MKGGVEALERVDGLLAGLMEFLSPDTLLVMTSDHGNLEDVTQGHTTNPVLCLLSGPSVHERREGLQKITDIPSLILKTLKES
jgi:phosphopentomutase